MQIGVSWLRANRDALDVVHFHWPETIWRGHRPEPRSFVAGVVHAPPRAAALSRFLHEARRLGIARVWTILNLEPQRCLGLGLVRIQLIGRSADVVEPHSAWSLEQAARRYRVKGRGLIMPMGTMRDAYPPSRPRDIVLSATRTSTYSRAGGSDVGASGTPRPVGSLRAHVTGGLAW